MKNKIFGLCILSIIILIGCAHMKDYDIAIRNASAHTLTDVHVLYDDFQSVGGTLSPGIRKTHLTPGLPIPEKATVEWRTEGGKFYQKEVEVKKHVPRRFRGDILFEIDDNNEVTVRAIQDVY